MRTDTLVSSWVECHLCCQLHSASVGTAVLCCLQPAYHQETTPGGIPTSCRVAVSRNSCALHHHLLLPIASKGRGKLHIAALASCSRAAEASITTLSATNLRCTTTAVATTAATTTIAGRQALILPRLDEMVACGSSW